MDKICFQGTPWEKERAKSKKQVTFETSLLRLFDHQIAFIGVGDLRGGDEDCHRPGQDLGQEASCHFHQCFRDDF